MSESAELWDNWWWYTFNRNRRLNGEVKHVFCKLSTYALCKQMEALYSE